MVSDRPPFLKKGDYIGIVAPARPASEDYIEFTTRKLESWGLNVILGKHLFGNYRQFSGSDLQRAEDVQNMLDDNKVKAILMARGGYGSIRIIDLLKFDTFLKSPKWIAGYSDVSVFHLHLNCRYRTQTLHSTMPVNMDISEQSLLNQESLRKALFGEKIEYSLPRHHLNKNGEASGIVLGGNLSILYNLMASPSAVFPEKFILFIEDTDEYLYHIDRMMMNLKRSGLLNKVSGLITGSMSKMNDNSVPFGMKAEEIVATYFEDREIPLVFGFCAGHQEENRAFYLGANITLRTNKEKAEIEFSN